MKKIAFFALSTLAAAATLVACGGGDDGPKNIEIQFAAVSDGKTVTCASTLTGLGTTNATGTLADLRFYISNVKLINSAGAEVPLTLTTADSWNTTKGSDAVTLIDLEDKTNNCVGTSGNNAVIKGTVPAGTYTGVKMTLGVPFALNHTDQSADVSVTPAVINNGVHPGMAWSWAGGRKFTKIEVTNSTWSAKTFTVHLGSTGCTGTNPAAGVVTSCTAPNRVDFGFTAFNPDTQRIAVDVKSLLSANDVTVNGGGASGCMSGPTDPECPAIFSALSLDLATGLTVNGGLNQRLFKVVSK